MAKDNRLTQKLRLSKQLFDINNTAKVLYFVVIAIIVLVPFHGFFTTWIGSNTGGLLLWRAWKELLLAFGCSLGILLLIKDSDLRQTLFNAKDKLVWVMLIFVAWQVLRAVTGGENAEALILGLVIQVRMFLFFGLAAIVAYYARLSNNTLKYIVLIPATVVVLFGILQMTVLPHSFLSHFGYQKNVTIPPFFTIDEQLDQIRIASTLRGPNPLGVYLIVLLLFLICNLVYFIKDKNWNKSLDSCLLLFASLVVLYGSHSRGAWLGFVAATSVWLFLAMPTKLRKVVVVLGVTLIPFFILITYQFKNTEFIQNVILHDNPKEGGKVSSNQGHLESLKLGISNVKQDPVLGCGVGCAGPASAYNIHGAKFSENYFLQTAEESGIIGLILLGVVFGLMTYRLYKASSDPIASILLASFIGVSTASLTAHAWADDTVS